jgi:hypothetical protein
MELKAAAMRTRGGEGVRTEERRDELASHDSSGRAIAAESLERVTEM